MVDETQLPERSVLLAAKTQTQNTTPSVNYCWYQTVMVMPFSCLRELNVRGAASGRMETDCVSVVLEGKG